MKPINDEVPVVGAGLKAGLSCAEGQEVVLTTEYIYATDRDSDNSSLSFLIVQQPHHGVVLREGAVVDRFIQADIAAGIVTYKHTGANRERVVYLLYVISVVADAVGWMVTVTSAGILCD